MPKTQAKKPLPLPSKAKNKLTPASNPKKTCPYTNCTAKIKNSPLYLKCPEPNCNRHICNNKITLDSFSWQCPANQTPLQFLEEILNTTSIYDYQENQQKIKGLEELNVDAPNLEHLIQHILSEHPTTTLAEEKEQITRIAHALSRHSLSFSSGITSLIGGQSPTLKTMIFENNASKIINEFIGNEEEKNISDNLCNQSLKENLSTAQTTAIPNWMKERVKVLLDVMSTDIN